MGPREGKKGLYYTKARGFGYGTHGSGLKEARPNRRKSRGGSCSLIGEDGGGTEKEYSKLSLRAREGRRKLQRKG